MIFLIIFSIFLAGVGAGFIGLRFFSLALLGALALYFYILFCLGVASPLEDLIDRLVNYRTLSSILSYLLLVAIVAVIVIVSGFFLDRFIQRRVHGRSNNYAGAFLGFLVGFALEQIFHLFGFLACLGFAVFSISSYLYSRSQLRIRQSHDIRRLNRQRQQWLEQQLREQTEEQLQGGDINNGMERPFRTDEQQVFPNGRRFPNGWDDSFNREDNETIQWPSDQDDTRGNGNAPRW